MAAVVLTVAAEAWENENQMRFGRLTVEDGLRGPGRPVVGRYDLGIEPFQR
jgi:hypothetical protein